MPAGLPAPASPATAPPVRKPRRPPVPTRQPGPGPHGAAPSPARQPAPSCPRPDCEDGPRRSRRPAADPVMDKARAREPGFEAGAARTGPYRTRAGNIWGSGRADGTRRPPCPRAIAVEGRGGRETFPPRRAARPVRRVRAGARRLPASAGIASARAGPRLLSGRAGRLSGVPLRPAVTGRRRRAALRRRR